MYKQLTNRDLGMLYGWCSLPKADLFLCSSALIAEKDSTLERFAEVYFPMEAKDAKLKMCRNAMEDLQADYDDVFQQMWNATHSISCLQLDFWVAWKMLATTQILPMQMWGRLVRNAFRAWWDVQDAKFCLRSGKEVNSRVDWRSKWVSRRRMLSYKSRAVVAYKACMFRSNNICFFFRSFFYFL